MKEDIILLSINSTYKENMSELELYEATNFAWEIKKERIKNNSIKYAFAIFKNKVIEVYKIEKWVPAKERIPKTRKIDRNDKKNNKRFAFDGTIAYGLRTNIIGKKSFAQLSSGKRYGYFEDAKRFYKLPYQEQIIYPDEIEDNSLFEGTKKQVLVNAYERSSQAREECISHYGSKCQICDFDFEKTYGDVGKNFIHVHHIVDISTIGENYKISPIKDLIPVCPNCHAMLHKRKPAYSPDDIKRKILKRAYNNTTSQ